MRVCMHVFARFCPLHKEASEETTKIVLIVATMKTKTKTKVLKKLSVFHHNVY